MLKIKWFIDCESLQIKTLKMMIRTTKKIFTLTGIFKRRIIVFKSSKILSKMSGIKKSR